MNITGCTALEAAARALEQTLVDGGLSGSAHNRICARIAELRAADALLRECLVEWRFTDSPIIDEIAAYFNAREGKS